jgi:hypothetical protein
MPCVHTIVDEGEVIMGKGVIDLMEEGSAVVATKKF